MEKEKKKKEHNILGITLIAVLVLLITAAIFTTVSYAFWQKTYEQSETNELKSGCFSYRLTENTSSIHLENTYPMSESDAMKNTPYSFTIENNCSIDMYYNVTLNTTRTSDLDPYLNYKLIDESSNVTGPTILSTLPTYDEYNNFTYTDENGSYDILKSYILTTGSLKAATMNSDNTQVITPGESKTYELYLWMDENVTDFATMAKEFEGKIIVTSSTSSVEKTFDRVSLGDYIVMYPSKTSYTIDTTKTGFTNGKYTENYSDYKQDPLNLSELNLWRVIKKDEDGTIEIVSEYISSTPVYFFSTTGYINYVGVLNEIAKQYENDKFTIGSRAFGYKNQTEYITDTSKILNLTNSFPWTNSTEEGVIDASQEIYGAGDLNHKEDLNLVKQILGTYRAKQVNPEEEVNNWLYASYWVGSRRYMYVLLEDGAPWGAFGLFVSPSQESINQDDSIRLYAKYPAGVQELQRWASVRPILKLKSGLTATGSGTKSDPFILE